MSFFLNFFAPFGGRVTGLIIEGDEGDNLLLGSRRDDQIDGGGGRDLVLGGRGDDYLFGGDDDDVIFGGRGDDRLQGDRGDDVLFGGRGQDLVVWNNGDGSDIIDGGRGRDRQQVNFDVSADGPALDNDDRVEIVGGRTTTVARTELNGQTEQGLFALTLRRIEEIEVNAGSGEDTVVFDDKALKKTLILDGGADSADHVPAKSAADLHTGDTLDLSQLTQGVRVDLDENNQGVLQDDVIVDGVNISDATAPGLSEFGNLQIDGEVVIDELDDFENVIGTDFGDTIFGNAQNNVLLGGDGDDALHPFGGDDFVDGGAGTDILLLQGFGNGQFIDFKAGVAGNLNEAGDGIAEGASVNRFVHIENVNGSSVGGDVILGDNGDNVLNGLGGNDVIDGGKGDDVVNGGTGDNDLLTGGKGHDSFLFANGDGNGTPGSADQIQDFSVHDDRFVLDAESFGLGEDAEVAFQNVERDGDGLSLDGFDADANVYVLQGSFANAGAARNALAEAIQATEGETDGAQAGFFIYFNEAQGRNRLFAVEDLDQVGGAIQQVANLGGTLEAGDPGRDAALAQLPTFEAGNFSFDLDTLIA